MRTVKLLIFAVVAWYVAKTVRDAWGTITAENWQLEPAWLAASAGFYVLGLLPAGWFWHRVLLALGQSPRWVETLRAYCIGHLGKYVPGKAMVVVLRAGLVRSPRVHGGVAAAGVFFETLTMMAVGAFWAAGVLTWRIYQGRLNLVAEIDSRLLVVGTLAMMAVSGLPTLPPVFRRLARLAGIGRGDPETLAKLDGLGYGTLAFGWVANTAVWLILGASLWAAFRGLGIDRLGLLEHLADYTAATALSVVVGFLSMIPAGFGARDVLLAALNVKFFGVNEGEAVVAAVVLRLVWLVAELVVSGILYLGVRRARQRGRGGEATAE